MINKLTIGTTLFLLAAGTANAEETWVRSGGIQRFFFGTTLATNGGFFDTTEKTANFAVNFGEDARYVFGFSANYGGNSFTNNTAEVMFGLNGKDYSLVIGKSATAHLCVSEVKGEFFASSSVYASDYAFTAEPLTKLPNVTVLESKLPKAGSYTYEITLTTSSSGKGNVTVFVPELSKTYSYDLKLTEGIVSSLTKQATTSLIGLRFFGASATGDVTEKYRAASVGSGISVQKYVLKGIPEPSAFGLLSGIAGISLVASRRRRK